MGYFAYAQYDVLYSGELPRHFVPRNDSISGLSIVRWDISLTLNMTYFLSPIGALRHFAYAADAPLLSLSRHFPRFSGGIYPEGGSEFCLCEGSVATKQSPGRVEVYGVDVPFSFGGIFR